MRPLLILVLLLPVLAQADPITFSLTSATINGEKFTPAQADGKWIERDGLRIKLVANGMVDPSDPESLGVFWSAMTSAYTAPREFTVALYGRFCVDGSCADVVTGGVITTSKDGMAWLLPPPPQTYTGSDGRVFTLSMITNHPGRGWTATIDGNLKGALAPAILTPATPIPEPMSLALLGSGLAGLSVISRRRRRR